MVDTKELRQGNILIYNDRFEKVVGFVGNKIYHEEEEGEPLPRSLEQYEGVPLTTDILERTLFTYNSNTNTYEKDGFAITGKDGAWNLVLFGDVVNYNPMAWLHQLQNVYFDLTGEEVM